MTKTAKGNKKMTKSMMQPLHPHEKSYAFGLIAGAGLMKLVLLLTGVMAITVWWMYSIGAILIIIGYVGHGKNAMKIRDERDREHLEKASALDFFQLPLSVENEIRTKMKAAGLSGDEIEDSIMRHRHFMGIMQAEPPKERDD